MLAQDVESAQIRFGLRAARVAKQTREQLTEFEVLFDEEDKVAIISAYMGAYDVCATVEMPPAAWSPRLRRYLERSFEAIARRAIKSARRAAR